MPSSRVESLQVAGSTVPVRVGLPSGRRPAMMVPSVGEYPVYDGLLYRAMVADDVRSGAFARALRRGAPGATVLDLGTGAEAVWAIAAARAGARRVYAVEAIAAAADRARAAVAAAGVDDRVEIVEGLSTDVELPRAVDLCVSETIGTIAGSEGAARVLADARSRLLGPRGRFIPQWAATTVGAVDLSELLGDAGPCVWGEAREYVAEIFDHVGGPFDLRMCIGGLREHALLSTRACVERLEFDRGARAEGADRRELGLVRPGLLHGLALGVALGVDEHERPIDSLTQPTSWFPVFVPLFAEGVAVRPGDRLLVDFAWRTSDDGVHPDYRVHATLLRPDAAPVEAVWESPHHAADAFRGDAFYARLFPPPDGAA